MMGLTHCDELQKVTRAMPKMKTHKGTKKRFRLTATGKVKCRRAGTSHLATHKTHKQKRNLRGTGLIENIAVSKNLTIALNGYSY
jgi:large subunit ribosomal protein L35